MNRYKFPNKPILPVPGSRRLRHAVDKWMKLVEHHNPTFGDIKAFGEVIDEAILDDIRKRAQKENNEEEIKEFLDQFSTKIGEDK